MEGFKKDFQYSTYVEYYCKVNFCKWNFCVKTFRIYFILEF